MKYYLLSIIIMISALLCVCTAGGFGATPRSCSITGIVTGPDGARLPGAVVTAHMEGTEETALAISNSSGMYHVPDLQAGKYQISAELTGFETLNLPDLSIDSGDR